MRTNLLLVVMTSGALALITVGGPLAEETMDERSVEGEQRQAMTAPISLAQAIATAEAATSAKAFEAGYETRDGLSVVIVKLVKSEGSLEAVVDADSGGVLAMMPRTDEEDDAEDDEG